MSASDPHGCQICYDCMGSCAREPMGQGCFALPELPLLSFVFAMLIGYSMVRGNEQAESDKRNVFLFFVSISE